MLGFIIFVEVCLPLFFLFLLLTVKHCISISLLSLQKHHIVIECGNEAWKVGDDGIQGPEIVIMGLEYEANEQWHPILEVS